jgi:hypothetical protein
LKQRTALHIRVTLFRGGAPAPRLDNALQRSEHGRKLPDPIGVSGRDLAYGPPPSGTTRRGNIVVHRDLKAACAAEQTTREPSGNLSSRHRAHCPSWLIEKVNLMLYTVAVVLLIMWLLGLVTSYTLGGFIHILLVVALVMILINIISGRRAL